MELTCNRKEIEIAQKKFIGKVLEGKDLEIAWGRTLKGGSLLE